MRTMIYASLALASLGMTAYTAGHGYAVEAGICFILFAVWTWVTLETSATVRARRRRRRLRDREQVGRWQ